jgi:hypothetical protein
MISEDRAEKAHATSQQETRMTRDDIIRMAKEAGWKRVGHNPETGPAFPVLVERLERFAALVAAAIRARGET